MEGIERKLLRLLLVSEFYESNKQKLLRDMFPPPIDTIYDTITHAHKKYARDLTVDEIRALHGILYPTLTTAVRAALSEVWLQLSSEDTVGADIAADVLSQMWKIEIGRQIVDFGLSLTEGTTQSLTQLEKLIEATKEDFTPSDGLVAVSSEIEDIVALYESRSNWAFNIPSLREKVPGISGGSFTYLFARPEVGKTASWVSMAAAPGGWCHQGARVHAFVNEEPGFRTRMRSISACTGLTEAEILQDPSAVRDAVEPIRDNLKIYDAVDISLDVIDAHCNKHRPDIVIVDQLDKIKQSGQFAREDQRLRQIYIDARQIWKKYDIAGIALSQASADAEGRTIITYAMMDGSKTGKAAEADLIIGIGKEALTDGSLEPSKVRYLTLSKNKLNGFHGTVLCSIKPELSRYIA